VQPLLQLVDIRLQLSRFRGQATLDIRRRAEDEPMNRNVRNLANAPLHRADKGKDIIHLPNAFVDVRLFRELDQLA